MMRASLRNTRVPPGHPEGYLEAFANIYRSFFAGVRDGATDQANYDFPTVDDGLRGMAFVDTVVRSATSDSKWTAFS